MPTFSIQTPSGKTLDIEAPDEGTALRGAQEWHAANAPKMSAGETATDVAKSGGIGLVKGTLGLGGMLGDLTNAGAKGIRAATDYIAPMLGVTPEHPSEKRQSESALNVLPTTESLTKRLESVTGPLYEPKSGAGHLAQTIGEFTPGALAGGQGVVGNLARYAVLPGLATEGAGKALEGSSWKPYGQAAAGVAASLANPSRLITPLPISPVRQAMVDTLHNEGVTSLTAGQKTGNEALKYLESASSSQPMAGGGAARIQGEGQHQFTEATVRRAGAGPDASPEVLGPNQRRLGQTYDQISQRNTLVPDPQFGNDLGGVLNSYDKLLEPQQKAIVANVIDGLISKIGQNNGVLPGVDYQAIRSELRVAADGAKGAHKEALRGIKQSLDDLMQRSVSPQDAALWSQTNREYAAQKVIEKAASRAGEATAEGQITPANLRNTVSAENRGAYSRGEGQFNDLARAGTVVMSPLPNSGTAQRSHAIDLLHLGNQATLGLVPAVTGRALMSRPIQNYMANQLITGGIPTNSVSRDLLMAQMLQRLQQPPNQPQ